MRDPFSESSPQPENLTLREEEELCEVQPDSKLKMKSVDLFRSNPGFCEKEYPDLLKKTKAGLL